MDYLEIIVDQEITLRQLRVEEAVTMRQLIDKDREYLSRWLEWVDDSNSVEDTATFIQKTIEERASADTYNYGIYVKGELVGSMGLMQLKAEPEIGYWVASDAAGHGTASRAVTALTEFGFQTLSLAAIIICVDPDNQASTRVAEKAGYHLRGFESVPRLHKKLNVFVRMNS